MVYVLLAQGFEEIEALTPVDLLRRAGVSVATVGIGGTVISGGHQISVQADIAFEDVSLEDMEMLVLPGGMGNVDDMIGRPDVLELIKRAEKQGIWIAAICAAPRILDHLGLLDGRRAVCYPTVESRLSDRVLLTRESVVVDGHIITAQAVGKSFLFAAKLVEVLRGKELSDAVMAGVYY